MPTQQDLRAVAVMAAEGLPVERCCALLNVSVSGYYASLVRPHSARTIRHAWLTEIISQVHTDSRETYGAKRVHAELTLGRGIHPSLETVEHLMRRGGLQGVSGRPKFRKIHNVATASELVDRKFTSERPDRLYIADITEHPTREGKVYCAVVLDTSAAELSAGRSILARLLRW